MLCKKLAALHCKENLRQRKHEQEWSYSQVMWPLHHCSVKQKNLKQGILRTGEILSCITLLMLSHQNFLRAFRQRTALESIIWLEIERIRGLVNFTGQRPWYKVCMGDKPLIKKTCRLCKPRSCVSLTRSNLNSVRENPRSSVNLYFLLKDLKDTYNVRRRRKMLKNRFQPADIVIKILMTTTIIHLVIGFLQSGTSGSLLWYAIDLDRPKDVRWLCWYLLDKWVLRI